MIARGILQAAQRVVRQLGPRRLMLLGLLLVALCGVGSGLAASVRELDLGLLLFLLVLAALLGWALASLPLPAWSALVLAVLAGFGVVLLRVGRLGDDLAITLQRLLSLVWQAVLWVTQRGPFPDFVPVVLAGARLSTGANVLLHRTGVWLQALLSGRSAFDPVAAVFTWSLAVWVVSAWAAWLLRRGHQVLYALFPAGVLLATTVSYAGEEFFVLLWLLGAALLLMAVAAYDNRVRRWQAGGVDFGDVGYNVATVTIALTVVLVTAAALTPSISVQRIADAIRELRSARTIQTRPVGESLGVEAGGEGRSPFRMIQETQGLPLVHLLTGGPELSQQVVMAVSTGDLPPAVAGREPLEEPPRYYWRSHTYDRYNGRGWSTGETTEVEYAPSVQAITTTLMAQRTVRHEVRFVGESAGLLYTAGTLIAADHDYRVAWRTDEDMFGATIEADIYRADSSISVATDAELRSAGSDYPEWVRARYLGLPDTIPARVLALARDLTAVELTPYDRAHAIENYLRAFSYTLDVPLPPAGREVVDYFLFDLQKGYCSYYATSMVVLARAAGLPARLVIGYAGGSYDPIAAEYVVTQENAHAWVEIYFPGYGWVEFEPTAGLSPIARSADEMASQEWAAGPLTPLRPAYAWWNVLGWPWWLWVAVVAGLAVGIPLCWVTVEGCWLRRLSPAAALSVLYGRLRRHGRRLIPSARGGDTPYEFAASLAGWVEGRLEDRRWARLLAPVGAEARCLVELYVQASYSCRPAGVPEQARAAKAWRRLGWRLWLARLGRRETLARTRRGR